jgi:hypothetical protein
LNKRWAERSVLCSFFWSDSYAPAVIYQVLDEIADAQVQMCETLETSMSTALEAFCGTQLPEVSQLKAEAEQMTEAAENSFSRYLNGRNAADIAGDSWNKLSDQVGQQIGSTFGKWKAGNEPASQTGSNFKSNSSAHRRPRAKPDADPALVMATTSANLKLSLEQIRLAQAAAELKRFQLLKKLVSIKVSWTIVSKPSRRDFW